MVMVMVMVVVGSKHEYMVGKKGKLSPIEYGDVKRRNESEKCLATPNRGFNNYNHD